MSDEPRIELLLQHRRYKKAEAAAREWIAREPDSGNGYAHLARALANQGRTDDAVEAARVAVGKNPESAYCLAILGWVLNRSQRYAEAEEALRDSLQRHPSYQFALSELAWGLSKTDRHAEALATALDGLRYHPTDEDLLYRKGWAEKGLGDWGNAIETAEQGLAAHPASAALRHLRGCVRYDMARRAAGSQSDGSMEQALFRSAYDDLAEAVRLNPGEPSYRNKLRSVVAHWRGNFLCSGVIVAVMLTWLCMGLAGASFGSPPWVLVPVGLVAGLAVFALYMWTLAKADLCVLALPASLIETPSIPLNRKERWAGLRQWLCLALVIVLTPVLPLWLLHVLTAS